MIESKIELHDRLRRQGKWTEAAAWKDAKIKELRAQGLKGAAAKDEAWRLMAEKFPPPPPQPDEDLDDEDELDEDELDDEDMDELDPDIDGYKSNPQMIATARKWLDDPETCSNPDSPFHKLMRRIVRDKALLNAYVRERLDQRGITPSAASEAETGHSAQA